MSTNPSTKWFWNDWDNDRALALCSFAAQGLWIRMLSIAARADGYLRVAGKPCSMDDLSVLVGHPVSEIVPLIAELEDRGVFSRSRDGTIYSRRIVRDEKNRKFFQKKGKEGGNPQLLVNGSDKTKKSETLNPPFNGPDKGGGSPPRARSLLPIPKEDSVVPNGTPGADAPSEPPDPPVDPAKEMWARGVRSLGESSRGLIGRSIKEHGPLAVMEAILACENETPFQRIPFFIGCLKQRSPKSNGKQSPVTKLYAGAYLAGEDWDRGKRDRGDRDPPDVPLLDRRRPN